MTETSVPSEAMADLTVTETGAAGQEDESTLIGLEEKAEKGPFDEFYIWLRDFRQGAKSWTWLESNPATMNQYLQSNGLQASWQLVDIWGTDPELLLFVPQPVVAVTLVFPYDLPGIVALRQQKLVDSQDQKDPAVWHSYQKIRGACGTYGLLHAVMNNYDKLEPFMTADGFYRTFYDETRGMDAAQKATALHDKPKEIIETTHEATAASSDTTTDTSSKAIAGLHFTSYVHVNGGLYEMDGLAPHPIRHGNTTPENLLFDAINAIKGYMAAAPGDVRFGMMALTVAQE